MFRVGKGFAALWFRRVKLREFVALMKERPGWQRCSDTVQKLNQLLACLPDPPAAAAKNGDNALPSNEVLGEVSWCEHCNRVTI